MTKLSSILLTILLFASCIHNDRANKNDRNDDTLNTNGSKQMDSVIKDDHTIKLDFFNEIPDTISGCGEFFTYDTSAVTKGRYIFLSNLAEFAIIKINGKSIYLIKDTIESKVIDDKNYIEVFKSQEYKVVLTIKQAKTYDEGGFYYGTLQIIGVKTNALFKVHGEAGC
jgi:hypothetical protein